VETLEARVVPAGTVIARAPDVGIQRRLVGDFNGDGKADTATLYLNGSWQVSLSTGTRFADPVVWANWSGQESVVRLFAADFKRRWQG